MYRNLAIAIAFLGIPFLCFGQDATLKQLLAGKDDTSKVNRLQAYGQGLLDIDNQKAIPVYEATINISKKLNYDYGLATAYRKIGYIKGQEGNYKEAISYYRNAIDYYDKGDHLKDILVCYNNIGANYAQFGKVDSTIHYYLLGIKRLEASSFENKDASAIHDMKSTYALLHGNISGLYGNMGNIAKAVEYGTKAISIAREINDTVRLVLSMVSLSHAWHTNKEYEQSLATSREAAQLAKLQGEPVPAAKAYHLLSVSYTGLGKLDSAIYAAKISMRYAKNSDQQLYITSFLDLADAYHDKKEYKKEEALLEQGLKEFKAVDNVSFGRNIYGRLADLNYAQGKYKAAYDHFAKSMEYKDSILSQQNRDAVAELEIQYQTAQKEKSLSEKQLQLIQKDMQVKKSRQYMYFFLGGLIVAALVAVILYLQFRNKKIALARDFKSLQQEKEIQVLQALMQGEEKERSRIAKDLHDGVAGMLAAVKMHLSSDKQMNEIAGYQQAIKLLDEAASEVRKTSHNLMPEVLFQHGLDEALARYCSNISNASTIIIQYDSLGSIDRFVESFELSVYRIVQELLNNILKHSKATQAVVQISQQYDVLSITIEDNGIGFKNNSMNSDGMGLRSLKSRIKAINGKIEVESDPDNGVSAYLEFETTSLKKEVLVNQES
jgi:signal transduction histidine kinase